MLTISGGQWRGRKIQVPKDKSVRPTTSMVRQSIFNRYQHQIRGVRFLDLFSGSGLMSFEALSRGAAFALGIEANRQNARLIAQNASYLGLETSEQYKVLTMTAEDFLARTNQREPFDMVFCDPPYGYQNLGAVIQFLDTNGWLAEDAVVMVEHALRDDALEGFERHLFGDTCLSIR